MNSWLKCGVLCCAVLSSSPLSAATGGVGLTFEEWVEEFRREAVDNGISAQSLDRAFQSLRLEPAVITMDRKQPEFRRDFQSYIDNAINTLRIKKAQKLMNEHADLLKQIEQKYKVPANYLLAFWGMETNFGTAKGTYPTINVLATLAYDTRRPAFFRSELMHGVYLIQDGIPVDKMTGSWAGAVGNFQFMPSTFRHFGIDYDSDGQVDLWNAASRLKNGCHCLCCLLKFCPQGSLTIAIISPLFQSLCQYLHIGFQVIQNRIILNIEFRADFGIL